VVIDNSGYFPRMVAASAQLLAPQATQYIFISSISAYAENPADRRRRGHQARDADRPNGRDDGRRSSRTTAASRCCASRPTRAAFPGRATIVRPGYIVGPGDPTDRFTYWPARIARGGEVLAPGAADDPLQWIDVRDLAAWLVLLCERETFGTFNAVGPTPAARWADVLAACVAASPKPATLTWVPATWLDEQAKAGGDPGFPIWNAPVGEYAGFHRWNNRRAVDAGLTMRPIADTVEALVAWIPGELERRVRVTGELRAAAEAKGTPVPPGPDPALLRAGPPAAREAELLAAWRAAGK
jgi:2'-hydroxyisoflavone reductase